MRRQSLEKGAVDTHQQSEQPPKEAGRSELETSRMSNQRTKSHETRSDFSWLVSRRQRSLSQPSLHICSSRGAPSERATGNNYCTSGRGGKKKGRQGERGGEEGEHCNRNMRTRRRPSDSHLRPVRKGARTVNSPGAGSEPRATTSKSRMKRGKKRENKKRTARPQGRRTGLQPARAATAAGLS